MTSSRTSDIVPVDGFLERGTEIGDFIALREVLLDVDLEVGELPTQWLLSIMRSPRADRLLTAPFCTYAEP